MIQGNVLPPYIYVLKPLIQPMLNEACLHYAEHIFTETALDMNHS